MEVDSYYQLLGVSRFASQDTIKRAFNSRIFDVHPDQNPGNKLAPELTRDLVEAYNILRDPKTRHQYDLTLSTALLPEVAYQAPISPVYIVSPKLSRIFAAMLAVLFIAIVGIILVQAAVSDRGWVMRPFLPEVKFPLVCRGFPVVIEPDVRQSLEWYQSQQYQLSLAHGWVTREMVKVYSHAADRAIRQGDRTSAEFYRAKIRDSRNDTDAVILDVGS